MLIKLGCNGPVTAYMNPKSQINGSMALIGISGSGKTVKAQEICAQIVEQGGTVVVPDFHGNMAEDQIFCDCRNTFASYRRDIYADECGMPCDLLGSMVTQSGRRESTAEIVGFVTSTLGMAYDLGSQQKSALRDAIKEVIETGEYRSEGIRAVGEKLKKLDNPSAKSAWNQMETLFERNLFVYGNGLITDNKINIIHFGNGMDTGLQEAAVSLLLAWIWRMGNAGMFKEKPIYVFVDECQTFRDGPKDPIPMILAEGRKLGINLLLATQDIKDCSQAICSRITQCAVMAYFKPKSDAIYRTAKMISPSEYKSWIPELEKLRRGEFIATGNLLIQGEEYNLPLRIKG